METLANLHKILRRCEPTTAIKALANEVATARETGATTVEIAEMVERAVSLKIIRNASVVL